MFESAAPSTVKVPSSYCDPPTSAKTMNLWSYERDGDG